MRHLDMNLVEGTFLPCPFCGEQVNVFLAEWNPSGQKAFGERWFAECKNMGCIQAHRTSGYALLKELRHDWNNRVGYSVQCSASTP